MFFAVVMRTALQVDWSPEVSVLDGPGQKTKFSITCSIFKLETENFGLPISASPS